MEPYPKRKNPRLKKFTYGSGYWYFITIVARDRARLFGTVRQSVGAGYMRPAFVELTACGEIAEKNLNAIPNHFPGTVVDKYCIMPDHVHLILGMEAPQGGTGRMYAAPTVSRVISVYKASVSRQWGMPVWQRSFYDHIIRNRQDYEEIWQYIDNNPLQWILDGKA